MSSRAKCATAGAALVDLLHWLLVLEAGEMETAIKLT